MLSPQFRTRGLIAPRLTQVVGPTAEPFSAQLEKSAFRIQVNMNLYDVAVRIATARTTIENKINRKLINQVWDMCLDDEAFVSAGTTVFQPLSWGALQDTSSNRWAEIELPFPPTIQVIGVYTSDQYGDEVQVDPSVYMVTRSKSPCRIRLNPGQSWPEHRGPEGLRVRFACGYATPFAVDGQGTVVASMHGLTAGDYVTFTSQDGTLPQPLVWGQSYTVAGLTAAGFSVKDSSGAPVTIDNSWIGTAFIGTVPSPLLRAMTIVSAMEQAGEIPVRLPGVAARMSPIEVPINPDELIRDYIWHAPIGG